MSCPKYVATQRFIRLRLILDIDEFSWLKMSEFALRGVEQLSTSMHVEFAIDMRDVSLYRAIRYIQRFTDIRPTTKRFRKPQKP